MSDKRKLVEMPIIGNHKATVDLYDISYFSPDEPGSSLLILKGGSKIVVKIPYERIKVILVDLCTDIPNILSVG
jgi:hypothetical protein